MGGTLKILNCYVKGNITSFSGTGGAGGIVGREYGTIELSIDKCKNFATVTSKRYGAGGIIGRVDSQYLKIKNCTNFGTITVDYNSHHGGGGIIGVNLSSNATIENCCNQGKLTSAFVQIYGENYWGMGGIIGYLTTSTLMKNVIDIGIVEADVKNIGGFIGRVNGVSAENIGLRNCYFEYPTMIKGIGSGITETEDELQQRRKTETQIKFQEFVNELNSNIENGCPYEQKNEDETTTTVTVDTTGWAKWVYNEGDYPTLDTSTTWNATTKTWEKTTEINQ